MNFKFDILLQDKSSRARAAKLTTPHGDILTPNLNPVGTLATVKALSPEDLKLCGVQIVLANTYHLHLRPGEDVIAQAGGLGKFMGWEGPTMTDSGGYQVFSLGVAQTKVKLRDAQGKKLSKFTKSVFVSPADVSFQLSAWTKTGDEKRKLARAAKVVEDGVWFFSHLNGAKEWFDANRSIEIQEKLGADLTVAFDDHESPLWDYKTTQASLERTKRWGLESLKAQTRSDQLMYGVTHGGAYEDLRIESAKFTDTHFPAIAVGGAYISKDIMYRMLDVSVPHFQADKPRHLLGIGEIQDLWEGVARGMDFFDCVAPTRRARHGSLFITPPSGGTKQDNFCLHVTNEKYKTDFSPIDSRCGCYTCQHFTRAYLHHLFSAEEILAYRLATIHNMFFVTQIMAAIRQSILEGQFIQLKTSWLG